MKKMYLAMLLVLAMLFTAAAGLASEAEQMPDYATFGEAVEAAGEEPVWGGVAEYLAVIVERDGEYYRVVTTLDDQAQELRDTVSEAEDIEAAFDTFFAYVKTLPVSYTEVFTAEPKDQTELDALAGKTVGELEEEGFFTVSSGSGGEDDIIIFEMSDGLYKYEFVADADFDTYEEKQDQNEVETITLKSGKFCGISDQATNLRYHADGTADPEEDAFAEVGWLMKIAEAFQTAQDGGEVDVEELINALAEEYPEAAELIRQAAETYKIIYQEDSVQPGAE